jgi:Rod binding domain-containing protein
LAEGILKNNGSETFYSLLDREYAGLASQTSSLGIADALVAQFRPNGKDEEQN